MSQVVYLSVKLVVDDNVDPQDVVNEFDYSFEHPVIKDYEIADFAVRAVEE